MSTQAVSTQTVINYAVEARRGDRPWLTMDLTDNEEAARKAYAVFLGGRRVRGFPLDYQLVKRTAVITDEVLESDPLDELLG